MLFVVDKAAALRFQSALPLPLSPNPAAVMEAAAAGERHRAGEGGGARAEQLALR